MLAAKDKGMTVKSARRAFRRAGWKIDSFATDGISFFLLPKEGRWIGICLVTRLTTTIFSDAISWRTQYKADIVFLTDICCTEQIFFAASASKILLLQWPDTDVHQDRLNTARQAGAEILAAAKTSIHAKLPPSQASLSRRLTPTEMASGFHFATKHISCWFEDRGTSALLVTFASSGTDRNCPNRWGLPYSSSAGLSCLGFETSTLNWFPDDDMNQCINAIEVIMRDRYTIRILLGAGQGGYAALRYSRKLKASYVLAFSPTFSIDPDLLVDPRFLDFYVAHLHSGMHIAHIHTSGKICVAYDPYDPGDPLHVQAIRKIIDFDRVKLPFSGHLCGHSLHNPELISRMIGSIVGDGIEAARLSVVQHRQSNPQRAFLMALHFSVMKPKLGLSLFKKYSVLDPGQKWSHVSFRLAVAGFGNDVFSWVKENADRNAGDPESQALVAIVGLNVLDYTTAAKYIHRALQLDPRSLRYRHIKSELYDKSSA